MDRLNAEFDQWISKSPPKEETREMLELLRKHQGDTLRELKDIRDHERDEVADLRQRLKLLRGEEKGKSTTDSGSGDTPIEKAYQNLRLARHDVCKEIMITEKENAVLARGDSDLLMHIVKAVFDFVSKEQQEQIRKITELLHIDEQDKGGIHDLQRSLGYDIEKALVETFFDAVWKENIYKPYTSKSPYLMRVKDEVHATMKHFVQACIQLVWLMLLETPPSEFCWNISKSQYRYANGVLGNFHPNDRIIYPALAVKQQNGEVKNKIRGLLQQEAELDDTRRMSSAAK